MSETKTIEIPSNAFKIPIGVQNNLTRVQMEYVPIKSIANYSFYGSD